MLDRGFGITNGSGSTRKEFAFTDADKLTEKEDDVEMERRKEKKRGKARDIEREKDMEKERRNSARFV